MQANRVKKLYEAGRTAYGTYVTFSTPAMVEVAAQAGFDFVRIDNYHIPWNPETMANMIRAAYDQDITPWVRCRNDAWTIMTALDMGAQAISISNIPSAEAAQAAVNATFYPPRGDRDMGRAPRLRTMSADAYMEWSMNEVFLSVQIEGREGLENYKEIVAVEGVDCIQSGRSDISLALGVPGEQFHPKVLEMEQRIVSAALEAGKQVSLVHPATDENLERMQRWIEQGVRIITVDQDANFLQRCYSEYLERLRQSAHVPH